MLSLFPSNFTKFRNWRALKDVYIDVENIDMY